MEQIDNKVYILKEFYVIVRNFACYEDTQIRNFL